MSKEVLTLIFTVLYENAPEMNNQLSSNTVNIIVKLLSIDDTLMTNDNFDDIDTLMTHDNFRELIYRYILIDNTIFFCFFCTCVKEKFPVNSYKKTPLDGLDFILVSLDEKVSTFF